MSATGTYKGTISHKTVGRGRLPDFSGDSPSTSHIPRPRPDLSAISSASPASPSPHTPGSDIGSSTTMSAASSRQRQNQSKRDEVCPFCRVSITIPPTHHD